VAWSTGDLYVIGSEFVGGPCDAVEVVLAGEFKCGLDRGFALGVGAQRGGCGDDFAPKA